MAKKLAVMVEYFIKIRTSGFWVFLSIADEEEYEMNSTISGAGT